ncbi:MAG TPA: universal stress protein, partial [Solirubrobacterales bacterium]|nr:universal stress protein [Solirubrobacterales bacterium]
MALKIIVSYDDTDNDRDALALGRLLARSGAELSLAYVRHSFGESLDQQAAEQLLARGAGSVGTPDMPKYVVVNSATSVGLAEVAASEQADVIVFGSEYRTANGLVKPGISAHKLLLGGSSAIAVAPAGLWSESDLTVATVG